MCKNNKPYYSFTESKINFESKQQCVESAQKYADETHKTISIFKLYGIEEFIEDGHLECTVLPN